MAVISAANPAVNRRPTDRPFYTWFSVGAALIIFVGFARSYYLKGVFRTPALSPLLHMHGLVMTAWFALFFVQVRLVATHRTGLHRRLGIAGAVLAALIVLIGTDVALMSARRDFMADPTSDALPFLLLALVIVLVFAIFIAGAILLRSRPDYHKRLMVLACVSILSPGIFRLPLLIHNASWWTLFGLNDLCLVVCMIYDAFQSHRLHPIWVWGASLLVSSHVLVMVAGNTPEWLRFAAWLVK